MERRNFIRLLIGLGIGIPILIEAATFFGLIERHLFPRGNSNEDPPTSTPAMRDRVGIGDELLPETPPGEILRAAMLEANQGTWTLTLAVEVENPTESAYEFRLGAVTLTNQAQIEGGGSTGRIPAHETRSMQGEWALPEGSTPDRVEAIEIAFPPDQQPNQTTADVPLAKIPVQSG